MHGGVPFFREIAPRIEEAVGPGSLPILTRGMLGQPTPSRYWFYNTEDLHHARKRTPAYLALLDGAERVFDYSEANVASYPRSEFRPIALGPIRLGPPAERPLDVLFFGHLTPRRKAVLDALDARVMDGLHGDALAATIRSARVVLCLNAYDDRTNDSFRVYPALECGGRLVVEACQEAWFNDAVRPYAHVVPYDRLVPTCRQLLAS